jgi:P-type Mg2+ transporter
VLKANAAAFHTGWLIESVLSAGLVVFAIRTRLPFLRSKLSRAMPGMTLLVIVITLALPYTQLPSSYLLAIGVIVVLYFASAEMTKYWFYRKLGD